MAADGLVRAGARADDRRGNHGRVRPTAWSTTGTACSTRATSSSSTCRAAATAASSAPGRRKDFWGVDQDADAFAQFIQRYLTQLQPLELAEVSVRRIATGRRVRPCSRAYLATRGIALNGIVLLSSFLNPSVDYNDGAPIGGGDWAYVLYLPTEAATAWYHRALPRAPGLNSLLSEVKSFALGEYLDALAQGGKLPPDRYNDVVAKLQRYTGLSDQYIRNSNLRIPYDRFENELLRQRGITVGRLDSRFQTYVLDRPEISPDWDATDSAIDAAFVATGNYYCARC